MRTNAIVRIILFSLAIAILCGLLLGGVGLRLFSANFNSPQVSQTSQTDAASDALPQQPNSTQPAQPQQVSGGQIVEADASKITEISIQWAAGNIRIEPSADVTTIQVQETEVDDKYKMICKVSERSLKIQFCKESIKFPSFGANSLSKDLVITVPADWICRELDIDAAAANVTIQNMTIGELDFDGASGLCTLENCHVTDLDVDAASGDLTFSGTLDTFEFDGASADCKLVLENCPKHIDLDGVSGDLTITLPSDCGFTAKTNGLSCDFSTDFQTTTQGSTHHHGDGSCLIEIDALSGNVSIHDGGYNCHEEAHHSSHH